MISIKKCSEVPPTDIYRAFALGFSDYVVPMTMTEEEFLGRFFGPEGNSKEHSFIAYDDEQPVGLVLSGIRMFDHLKTMRCGTLCVGPEYRGKKVSQALLEKHMEMAKAEKCRQLFLEVIKTNERAIRFYKKYGYEVTYDLKYYRCALETLQEANVAGVSLEEVDFERISGFRKRLNGVHINWQSELEAFRKSEKHLFLMAMKDEIEIGYIAMSPTGKIEQIYVTPEYRNQGIGTKLIRAAAERQKVEKVVVCFPSNASLEGYFRRMQYSREAVEQYEMYLPIME